MNTPILPNTSVLPYCVAKSPGEWASGGTFVFEDVYIGFSHFDHDCARERPDDEPHPGDFTCNPVLVEKMRRVLRRCWTDERLISETAHELAEALGGGLGRQAGELICVRPVDDHLYDDMERLDYLLGCLEVDRLTLAREAIADLRKAIEASENWGERASLHRQLRKLLKLVRQLTGPSLAHACIPPLLDTSQVEAPGGKNALHTFLN